MAEVPDFRSSRGARAATSPAAGDLEEVYRALAPAVVGYLRAQGARDPEDLAGDVFVAVARRLDRFDGDERSLRSFVFTIAHHRLVDERRRAVRRPDQPADPAVLAAVGPATSFEGDLVARLDAGPALAALRGLTTDQRAVVLLRILADLSVAEVARVLGKQPGAVKTLQRRAIAAMARALHAPPAAVPARVAARS